MAIVEIPLGHGRVAVIDAADRHLIAGHTWHIQRGHGAKRYAVTTVPGGTIFMHRLIAQTPDGLQTDHINGDGLDNRRANLRHATVSQNQANAWKKRRRGGTSSRYKGVSWHCNNRRWQANIGMDGTTVFLGGFASEIDAARAYDAAALEAWGEFAQLNCPDAGEELAS